MEKIAVLGGGAIGLSCAAHCAKEGYSVNLFELPQFQAPHIEAIQERGGIEVLGLIEELITLNMVTTDIQEALDDVDIILICVPAFGVELFVKTCIPYLKDGQTVIFHGKGGHILTFAQLAKKLGVQVAVLLGETHTAPYSSRLTAPGQVTIFSGWNRILLSAAFPAKTTEQLIAVLKKLYPADEPYNYKFIPAENVLSSILCDLNSLGHPVPLLFNLGLVESPNGIQMYKQGSAKSITKIRAAIDKERLAVMAGFGLKPIPIAQVREKRKPNKELGEKFRNFVVVRSTKERFITEDVPYGLVTIADLGDIVGVDTPYLDALINIANVVNETDYRATGRKAEQLGLSGLTLYQIRRYVEDGRVPPD